MMHVWSAAPAEGGAKESICASDVMRRWFTEVWTNSNGEVIEELFPIDGIAYGLGPPVQGPTAFRAFWYQLHATFSDIEVKVVECVDQGDRCYVRCEGSAIFEGKTIPLNGGCLCRIEDGMIREVWNYWDFVGTMEQMGALPESSFVQACNGGEFRLPSA